MKVLYSIVGAVLLTALLMTAVAAQSVTDHNPDRPLTQDELPWGMRIVFADGTTITEANQLRLEYNLVFHFTSYLAPDGRQYNYGYDDDSQYDNFARFHWSQTEHAGCSTVVGAEKPCPPIEPLRAFYDPVTERVEAVLLADARVAHIDNHNSPAFFLITMLKGILAVLWGR